MTTVHPQTAAVTAGRSDNSGALAPLVWATSAFESSSADEAAGKASTARVGNFYTRFGNPGVDAFGSAVAELEESAHRLPRRMRDRFWEVPARAELKEALARLEA